MPVNDGQNTNTSKHNWITSYGQYLMNIWEKIFSFVKRFKVRFVFIHTSSYRLETVVHIHAKEVHWPNIHATLSLILCTWCIIMIT